LQTLQLAPAPYKAQSYKNTAPASTVLFTSPALAKLQDHPFVAKWSSKLYGRVDHTEKWKISYRKLLQVHSFLLAVEDQTGGIEIIVKLPCSSTTLNE